MSSSLSVTTPAPPSTTTEMTLAEADLLLPHVYADLRRLAAGLLNAERSGHTLQPTALVHEAYLRLMRQRTAGWGDRGEFLAAVAMLMRRILVDHARLRRSSKRGGRHKITAIDRIVVAFEARSLDLVALGEALDELERVDPRKRRVVDLRFFGGLHVHEISTVLGIPQRTVERDWTMARAWLRASLDR